MKQKEGNFIGTHVDTLSWACDGCVTWNILAPWAMCCDLSTGQALIKLCALIG